MPLQHFLLALILLPLSLPVFSHGLSPSRLEAPSGSQLVAYRFTAINNYSEWNRYSVQCFKNDLNTPYECKSSPSQFNIAPKKSRTFKTQIAPNGDGVYLVCTIQDKEATVVTRVCSRFGVGVSAGLPTDSNRISQSTVNPSIPAGAGSNKGR